MSQEQAKSRAYVPTRRPQPESEAERVFLAHESELSMIDGFVSALSGNQAITVVVERASQLKFVPKEIEGVKFVARVGRRIVAETGLAPEADLKNFRSGRGSR